MSPGNGERDVEHPSQTSKCCRPGSGCFSWVAASVASLVSAVGALRTPVTCDMISSHFGGHEHLRTWRVGGAAVFVGGDGWRDFRWGASEARRVEVGSRRADPRTMVRSPPGGWRSGSVEAWRGRSSRSRESWTGAIGGRRPRLRRSGVGGEVGGPGTGGLAVGPEGFPRRSEGSREECGPARSRAVAQGSLGKCLTVARGPEELVVEGPAADYWFRRTRPNGSGRAAGPESPSSTPRRRRISAARPELGGAGGVLMATPGLRAARANQWALLRSL